MITSSGKQSDKEVESFFVSPSHADVYVCHRGIGEVKISLLSPSFTPLQGPSIFKFFFFKCTTVLWSGRENVILTKGQSPLKITAVSRNVDQSNLDSHFDSQIDPYILCILIEYLHSRREHKC